MTPLSLFGLSVFLAVTQLAPAPSPAPAQKENNAPQERRTLKEIGRVRAVTPFCRDVVENATLAVGKTFDGDARIMFVIDDLASVDFDTNILTKYHALSALTRRYNDLRGGILEGEKAITSLRARANTSANAEEKTELLTFTNSLGGALDRQHKLLRDLNGFLSFMESYDIDEPIFSGRATTSFFFNNGLMSKFARNAAADFDDREHSIVKDELIAADHVDAAFKRCAAALPDNVVDPNAPKSDAPKPDAPKAEATELP